VDGFLEALALRVARSRPAIFAEYWTPMCLDELRSAVGADFTIGCFPSEFVFELLLFILLLFLLDPCILELRIVRASRISLHLSSQVNGELHWH
jgi:hypothetical protein